jgi:hypothetical protein
MLRAYLRLAVFAVGLLAGVQVPGFIDQYAKRVSAHYLEVSHDFTGFQRTADQYFKGDVAALIAHHRASTDAVFRDEARTISALYERLQLLAAELKALEGGLPARLTHVIVHPNREILQETVAAYSYTVPLNGDAILCGVTAGLLGAILVESLLVGLVRIAGRAFGRSAPVAPVRTEPRLSSHSSRHH